MAERAKPRKVPAHGRNAGARGAHGRGAAENPPNRFERLILAEDPDLAPPPGDPDPPPRTRFYRDPSRRILSSNDSPDLPFDASLNPYRGCEHGCSYCYARPTHEYLGFSAGLDFETRILVKDDAPALLRAALGHPRWQPKLVAIGGVTDPYQPVEARLRLTRRCLEVFAEFRNPVGVVTKSALVTRDADLLSTLARVDAAAVHLSVTTLDRDLARVMEPRTSTPQKRLEAIRELRSAGVPVGVLIAPVIPGLNDHEVAAIVEACADAGALWIRHIVLRLPHGLKDLFEAWLRRHFPERADKVLARIRDVRGGHLNDPRFHTRQRGSGPYADQIHALCRVACRRAGVPEEGPALSTRAFRRPPEPQLSLFPPA